MSAAAYELNQYRFRIVCDAPDVGELFHDFLSGFVVEDPADATGLDSYELRDEEGLIKIWFGGNEVLPALPLYAVVDKILREVSSAGINTSTEHLAIHAGAVSRGGIGAILPAPSGSGKSTAVAALVQAGCRYLSDEAALLDLASGVLHPYPRPLCLSADSLDLLTPLTRELPVEIDWRGVGEQHVAPCQLRDASIGENAPLLALFAPRFEPEAETVCEPMRRSEAMLAVIRNSFNFARFGAPGLRSLATVMERVTPYRLQFGDIDRAAKLVIEVLDSLGAAGHNG